MIQTKSQPKKGAKRTYILPPDTLAKLESIVPAGQRGAAVAEALDHWLEEKRLAELRVRILEGLADEENEALSLEVEREWSPVSDELWSQLPNEEWPEPAIVWPQGLAAARRKQEKSHEA